MLVTHRLTLLTLIGGLVLAGVGRHSPAIAEVDPDTGHAGVHRDKINSSGWSRSKIFITGVMVCPMMKAAL